MKKNNIVDSLGSIYEMKTNHFKIFYDYFELEKDKDNLTLDEKVEMAGYLIDMDVFLHNGKYYGYPGKMMNLVEFLRDNVEKVSDDTLDRIQEHVDKQKERKRIIKELEVKEKYPEIYSELMNLRKDNYINQQKILKKEIE